MLWEWAPWSDRWDSHAFTVAINSSYSSTYIKALLPIQHSVFDFNGLQI
jgi:hypothetical protein